MLVGDYANQVQAEFRKLYEAAERKNKLFFLMTTFASWSSSPWSSKFVAHTNEFTRRLIWDRAQMPTVSAIPMQDVLFSLQVNLEAKAVYSLLRNLVFVASGKCARPEPWDEKRQEFNVRKKTGHVTMHTRRILENIVEDLQDGGFAFLADELRSTHITTINHIRNAIAHSSFCVPSPETNGKWVFATYAASSSGFLSIVPHEYTRDEFNEICGRFFGYRLGFARGHEECRAKYAEQTFDFQAENQMKSGEVLDCAFDRGTVSVKYKGTPLW